MWSLVEKRKTTQPANREKESETVCGLPREIGLAFLCAGLTSKGRTRTQGGLPFLDNSGLRLIPVRSSEQASLKT